MDLYTLTDQFLTNRPIDEFVSAIWTERYSKAGDTQLVLPATADNIDMLAPGVFLALRGTQEVMILETQSIENSLLTVTGRTLDTFLEQRAAWFGNPNSSAADERVAGYVLHTLKIGEFIADVVTRMAINPTISTLSGAWAPANLTWDMETIPHLTLGAVDTSGEAKQFTMPIGPLYDGITHLADQEGLGLSLYLESADPIVGYSLKFKTYRGKDRTMSQTVNPLIRLSPDFESIQDLKEIHSISKFKNVCYVYYQGIISKHLLDPTAPEPEGLERRVLIHDAEGAPVGTKQVTQYYSGGGEWYKGTAIVVGTEDIVAFREQNARDAFANYNYIRAIDGQTSPHNEYKFGMDYGLGDVIELEGLTGTISKARITEYIRSQDNTGEKEYPTISVVEQEGG